MDDTKWWRPIRVLHTLANQPWFGIIVVTSLALVVRVLLLPIVPIPKPKVADEFSHLLIADTFAHGRIANPTHPFWQHFDTIFILQQPAYASIYPPGHGIVMALGQIIGGHPWWGVWASTGLMCGAVCWMLNGWVEPPWALIGGLLCVFRFGLLSYWMNSYMGGSVPALGGALALGALPRLMRTSRPVFAIVLASGLAAVISVRPYEGLLFSLAVGAILLVWLLGSKQPLRQKLRSVVLPISCVVAVAAAAQAYYDFRVTGSALLAPYQLSQRLYGVPRGLFGLAPRPKNGFLGKDLRDEFEFQNQGRAKLKGRLRDFWRFYFGPLAIALLFLPLAWRSNAWHLAWICVFVFVGQLIYWYFLRHYLAPLTAACLGLVIFGLRGLWNWKFLNPVVRYCAVAAILLWDMAANVMAGNIEIARDLDAFAEARGGVAEQLNRLGGNHLIFVRYGENHSFYQEWIYNSADIDRSKIVWAREVDPVSDARMVQYFAGRSAWVVEPDAKPVHLSRWRPILPK